VAVIGGGPAGAAAALGAAESGARTVLVETTASLGGNAAVSTGYLAVLGSDEQKAAGLLDTEDQFLADLRTAALLEESDGHPAVLDEELARIFIRTTRATYDRLREVGVEFERFVRRPLQHTVDRMLAVKDVAVLRTGLAGAVESAGVDVRLETRAERLERRAGGWVIHLKHHDGTERMESARNVVLTAGGYQGNPALRRRFQTAAMAERPHLGLTTCRGDGHLMAASQGADLINMGLIPSLVIVGSAFVEDAIAVNSKGVRFHDETGPYERRVAAVQSQEDQRGSYIYDATTAKVRSHLIQQMPLPPVTADNLEGLADLLDVPRDQLRCTVETWNSAMDRPDPKDPFGRSVFPDPRRGITEPPFSAIPLVIGTQFTGGGCRVTDRMCVVDLFGDPIPGLYAAGDCVGGINAGAGLGGIHIMSALGLGSIAGRAAASGTTGLPTVIEAPGRSTRTLGAALSARIDLVAIHNT
jgi:succinate dehydrogenase/fumarate reductase flavoprotein subunit